MRKKGKSDAGGYEKQSVKYRISDIFELPKEVIMNLPLISLVGSQEINIENYKGVIEYSPSKIRISTNAGILKIEGRDLNLGQITSEIMAVRGSIKSLEFMD